MAHIEEVTQMSLDNHPFRVWYACSECEREIPHDSLFCAYCGVKFRG